VLFPSSPIFPNSFFVLRSFAHFGSVQYSEGSRFLNPDKLSTTGPEIKYFWRFPITQSAGWFLVNRYVAFFGNLGVLVYGFVDLPQEVRSICLSFGPLLPKAFGLEVCVAATVKIAGMNMVL
jgi:hypothetical protein